MYVEVWSGKGDLRQVLRDADEFGGFAVRVLGDGDSGFADAGNGEVYVPVDLVVQLATGVEDRATWRESYDGMLVYAANKGWLSPDGYCIRAHLEHVTH